MGSQRVRLFHDHVLVKEPATRQPTPWHQDQPYYNVDGRQACSLWMPVDPVDRESTLEFVAGSHLGPWLMPRTFMDSEAKWFPEGSLEELPDVEGDRDAFEILAWELEPGDAVYFHMLTLHAAGGATRRRRALSVRFLGDDVTHAPRPWKTSPDFPGLADELPAGAPMEHPLFPVVWEAELNAAQTRTWRYQASQWTISSSGLRRAGRKSVPSVYATGMSATCMTLRVRDAEQLGGLLLVREMERRPARAEAPRAGGEHEAPDGRHDRAQPRCLLRNRLAVRPALDARDDVHGHLAEVVHEVPDRVEQAPRPGRQLDVGSRAAPRRDSARRTCARARPSPARFSGSVTTTKCQFSW